VIRWIIDFLFCRCIFHVCLLTFLLLYVDGGLFFVEVVVRHMSVVAFLLLFVVMVSGGL
jgi:hypothetical protein